MRRDESGMKKVNQYHHQLKSNILQQERIKKCCHEEGKIRGRLRSGLERFNRHFIQNVESPTCDVYFDIRRKSKTWM